MSNSDPLQPHPPPPKKKLKKGTNIFFNKHTQNKSWITKFTLRNKRNEVNRLGILSALGNMFCGKYLLTLIENYN